MTSRVHFKDANKKRDVFSTLQTSVHMFVLSSFIPSSLLPFLLIFQGLLSVEKLLCTFWNNDFSFLKQKYQGPQESLNEWVLKQYCVKLIACCKRFQVKSENICGSRLQCYGWNTKNVLLHYYLAYFFEQIIIV